MPSIREAIADCLRGEEININLSPLYLFHMILLSISSSASVFFTLAVVITVKNKDIRYYYLTIRRTR